MKLLLTKEQYDGLSDEEKKLVTVDGEKFTLEIKQEDTGALKRAKDHEKTARKAAEDALAELQTKYDELDSKFEEMAKGNIPKKDVEALEESYKQKRAELETQYKAKLDAAETGLRDVLVDGAATSMATELAIVPDLLASHIKNRLTVEKDSAGKFQTRVLGEDGKVSATTLDELKAEIRSNESFKPILVGSKASGSGASGSQGGGATKKSLKEMTATEEAQFANDNPTEYQKMLADAGASVEG